MMENTNGLQWATKSDDLHAIYLFFLISMRSFQNCNTKHQENSSLYKKQQDSKYIILLMVNKIYINFIICGRTAEISVKKKLTNTHILMIYI